MIYGRVALQSLPRVTNRATGRCNTGLSPQDGAARVRLRSDANPNHSGLDLIPLIYIDVRGS